MQYKNLIEEKKKLESILSRISGEENELKGVKGTLRIQQTEYGPKYFQIIDKGDTIGRYIKQKDIRLARQLAQKDYCSKAEKAVVKELKVVTNYLKNGNPDALKEVYKRISPQRQKLVTPFELTDEMYLEKWKSKVAEPNSFDFGTTSFVTDNGERVRSKSEVIVANRLKSESIPYKYEYPLVIQSYSSKGLISERTIYPDFTVLNLKQRKEYRLELFGMMDDEQYRQKTWNKIELYAEIGYFIGDKLLVLFEEPEHPLNVKYLNSLIEKYLK